MIDHSLTAAASVLLDDEAWVLVLYDSAGEVIERVTLGWDGSGGFLMTGLDHVAQALGARGLAYVGSAAWSQHEGRWGAFVYRAGWPRRGR